MSDFPHFRKFLDTRGKKMDIRYKQVGLHNEYIIIKLFYTSFSLICHVDYMKSNLLIFILMNLHFEKNTLRLSLSNSQSQWIKSKILCTGMNMSAMFYIANYVQKILPAENTINFHFHCYAYFKCFVFWVFFFGFSSVCLLICLFLQFLFLICFLFFYILAIFMYSNNHFRLVRVMNIHV